MLHVRIESFTPGYANFVVVLVQLCTWYIVLSLGIRRPALLSPSICVEMRSGTAVKTAIIFCVAIFIANGYRRWSLPVYNYASVSRYCMKYARLRNTNLDLTETRERTFREERIERKHKNSLSPHVLYRPFLK